MSCAGPPHRVGSKANFAHNRRTQLNVAMRSFIWAFYSHIVIKLVSPSYSQMNCSLGTAHYLSVRGGGGGAAKKKGEGVM